MEMQLPFDTMCDDAQHVVSARVPPYSYAFQPIVDVVSREIFPYEALIRGRQNEPALLVLASVPEYAWFSECGIRLFQGYLFAKPGFESLPEAHFPDCV